MCLFVGAAWFAQARSCARVCVRDSESTLDFAGAYGAVWRGVVRCGVVRYGAVRCVCRLVLQYPLRGLTAPAALQEGAARLRPKLQQLETVTPIDRTLNYDDMLEGPGVVKEVSE